MALATSSFRESAASITRLDPPRRRALSTYTLLLTLLLLIVAVLTGSSLLAVWHEMRKQVVTQFSEELRRSVEVFNNAETERFSALQREDNLMADLPSLKALMTTDHDRTIEDGALEFSRTGGNDLFALVDRDHKVRAAYVMNKPVREQFRQDLSQAMTESGSTYLLSGDQLFVYATAPLYFGDAESGTLLGYVVNGYEIDTTYLARLSGQVDANAAFLSSGRVLATSLPVGADALKQFSATGAEPQALVVRGQRYLGVGRELSRGSALPLTLVFFKSLRGPEQEIRKISKLLLELGVLAMLLGSALMISVVQRFTGPLEALATRVRAYGLGKFPLRVDPEGTREVRELTETFAAMQERVERLNRARLESERLATIGSMASSVSHDLRHYLASIYANAEFLSHRDTTDEERAEFFGDIQTAVFGTTEMLESLLTFSRTGDSVSRQPERLEVLARRAITQVRLHPDAARAEILISVEEGETLVNADPGQMERALYNLLLNACQSPREEAQSAVVHVRILQQPSAVVVRIVDNGCGVSSVVQETLFDPFVSQGKQKGTGLGLTLCRRVAQEHGGAVTLVSSRPGDTVFELMLPRDQVPVESLV